MFGIEILREEHENIRKFTKYIRSVCGRFMEGDTPSLDVLQPCVDFMKYYADIHHHGKEEEILFKYMLENLQPMANRMINVGMMTDHSIGRFHVQALEEAVNSVKGEITLEQKLDIVTHALAYADLLVRHLEKENNVLYPFAENNLKQEILDKIDEESKAFEEEGARKEIGKYVEWLNSVYQEG